MTKSLFSEFAVTSREDWISQATRDLRGKEFASSLTSKLWDRIDLQPFYTLEDLEGETSAQRRFQTNSGVPGLPSRQWSNMISVFPGDSSESILKSLENGAEGLVLHLSGFEDLAEILKGVKPEYIPILIQPMANPIAALSSFLTWADKQGVSADQITGGLLWTPSDLAFDQGGEYGLAVELLQELLELAEPFPNFRAFSLKTSRYTEAGGNPLDAVILGLGELIELIDLSRETPEKVFRKMLLEVSVGDSHFGEIARLKTFREAIVALGGLYSVELDESELILLAQTSHWSKSILDANSNLIRQTYEAMAAVLGGVNLLWTRPLLEETAGDLEKRIARNVSAILKEEAYLDRVTDPAAGSFFLEKAQKEILSEIHGGLESLEENGGWLAAMERWEIHSRVRSYRQKIQNEIAENRLSKIGANKFPAPAKLKNDLEFEFFEEKSLELKPTRASYLTELQKQLMP